jgi:hypothetical protein
MNLRFKVNLPLILSTILVLAALLFPRVLELGQFVTADEPLWLARSANFTIALLRGDFINTYQKEHPGVTILWAGAGGLLWQYPEIRQRQKNNLPLDQRLTEYLRLRERPFTHFGRQPVVCRPCSRYCAHLLISMLSGCSGCFQLLGFCSSPSTHSRSPMPGCCTWMAWPPP